MYQNRRGNVSFGIGENIKIALKVTSAGNYINIMYHGK
jgi:hypothetical protein